MVRKFLSIMISSVMLINILALIPINAFAASGSSKTYEKDGYIVTYIVGNDWDKSQTIYITLKNTGEETILNWALRYDNVGSVSDIWNACVAGTTDEYIIVKNNGYNYEIAPGQSVSFGYTLSYEEKAMPEDLELYSRRIEVMSGYEVEFNVTDDWYTGFQGEISVANTSDEPIEAWTLNFDGNFDINNVWDARLISGENRSYTAAAELWTNPIDPGESVSFGFTADKSATENASIDNIVLTAVVNGESSLEHSPEDEPEDIDYELDTDGDGLPDYYEDILGTDKNNPDTDGDGIPDGYEVFYLGTDPTKADSDDNGKNDGDEDFDNDGLSNKKEYELGTDPNNADTDGDGLSDGAEVNTHGTAPLKYDTDEDGISDGDELKLGLDPKNGSTDGTPDSEKTFTQTVSADSEVLSEINNDEETPFKVSLEITAAGVAENNVYARESGYSNAIENSAIIGVAPEFVYTDGLAVEEVTVKFELDNSIVGNTLGTYAENNDGFQGIKRLMVFMFFEDVNMLLPVETNYDEANSTVSATTDRVGTYCLMDMELFFKNLGIEPDNSKNDEIAVESAYSVDKMNLMAYNGDKEDNEGTSSDNETDEDDVKDNFDVAFLIDEISYTDTQLDEIKKEIRAVSEIILKKSKDVTISIYGLDGSGLTHSTWYGRADNIENVEVMLSRVSHKKIDNVYNFVAISECIDYVIAAHKISTESAKRQEYGFVYYDPYFFNSDDELAFRFLADSPRTDEYGIKKLELIQREGTDIDFSTVTASYAEIIGKKSYANDLSEITNGAFINGTSYTSVVNESIEHIYGKTLEDVNVYKILIATNFEYVNLEKPITEKYIENSIKYGHNYIADISEFDEEDIADCADTDEDGLWDFQEIKVFKGPTESPENQIIWFEDGELMLPTVNEMTKEVFKDIYSSEEIYEFREHFAEQYGHNIDSEFWSMPVLPINSHPTEPDTDGDGLNDNVDRSPNHKTNIPKFFKQLIINEVVEYTQIVRLSDTCYICTASISELDASDFVSEYINGTNDISSEKWETIKLGLDESAGYYDCIASVYVGKDVVYFTAPSDTLTDRVAVIANQEADCHRKAIASSVLEDNKTYQTLIAYSESLSQQQYLENQEFEERISEMFNSNELFELFGFFDGNVIVGSVLDGVTNTADSFYKSACRLYNSLSFDNIKCNVVSTSAAYINYVTWYHYEYPDKTPLSAFGSFLGTSFETSAEYVALDINDRLFQGTAESRSEILGETLFNALLDISIAKALNSVVSGKADASLLDDLEEIRFKDVIDGNHVEPKSKRLYTIGNEKYTLTLRLANQEELGKILQQFDNSQKSKFVKFLCKYGDEADDIIERLPSTRKSSIKAVKTHFDSFIECYEKCHVDYRKEFLDIFSSYSQYADDILKYILNDGKYALEIIEKFGEQGIKQANISPQKMFEILGTEKGVRPDVSTYLSKDYINAHLSIFDEGVTVIQTDSAYKRFTLTNGFVGVKSDNSLFVMPKKYFNELYKVSNGNISYIEKALGFEQGHFSGGAWRIDINDVSNLNLRIPNGNEYGVNSYWIPGGYTSGGVPEAISNTVPISEITVERLC